MLSRGLDDCGHFWTLMVSFKREALDENIGKYQFFKDEIYGFFSLLNNSF